MCLVIFQYNFYVMIYYKESIIIPLRRMPENFNLKKCQILTEKV